MPKLSETEKEARRRRVLDGARRCFARYGYDGATVGVMVALDARVGTKSYGQSFLRSLPSCSTKRLRLIEAPGLVAQWLEPRE